jgi:Rrf2 family protein
MKFGRPVLYAVMALMDVSGREPGQLWSSHQTVRGRRMSPQALFRVCGPLVWAGILVSRKGPHGGYRLARPLWDISLLEVVEFIDGPIRGGVPLAEDNGKTPLERQLGVVCVRLTEESRGRLREVRIVELAGQ